ncbi:MAG: hypothetical protein HN867_12175 [Deltaproteobacteria bacterium]|jgi:hypothetical protein|nr:hypothetical protein [Deltaproteobacteria bacterium]MBT7204221.1 hypothetical protein [Deltaproteobacteria bacterium]
MSTSYRSRNLRSLAGALAVLLLIWLSVIPVHVQHVDGFRTPTSAFVSADLAEHLDCPPFPLTPVSTDAEPCPALLAWNAGSATLVLPPMAPILGQFLVHMLGTLLYQSPFTAKAWLSLASLRAPPPF